MPRFIGPRPAKSALAFFAAAALLVGLASAPRAVLAQNSPPAQQGPGFGGPSSDSPRPQRGDHAYNLDTLFAALKIAPDAESAKAIEEKIWMLWLVSGSDT